MALQTHYRPFGCCQPSLDLLDQLARPIALQGGVYRAVCGCLSVRRCSSAELGRLQIGWFLYCRTILDCLPLDFDG